MLVDVGLQDGVEVLELDVADQSDDENLEENQSSRSSATLQAPVEPGSIAPGLYSWSLTRALNTSVSYVSLSDVSIMMLKRASRVSCRNCRPPPGGFS